MFVALLCEERSDRKRCQRHARITCGGQLPVSAKLQVEDWLFLVPWPCGQRVKASAHLPLDPKACIWIATVFHANDAAATQQQSAAMRDNKADFQRHSGIKIVRRPDRHFIERRNGQQLINFDLFIKNVGTKAYNLVSIKLQVFDSGDHLELERELNENGRPPALDMIGERLLQPGKVLDVFQP